MENPRYNHDCDSCRFVGQSGNYDVWYCVRCDGGTWLARYSDVCSEYASYPDFVLQTMERDSWRNTEQSRSIAAIRQYRKEG